MENENIKLLNKNENISFFSLDFLKQKIIITYKSINKISGEVITILLIINIIFIILLSKHSVSLIITNT